MLACARIGAVHSVVFGGFAAARARRAHRRRRSRRSIVVGVVRHRGQAGHRVQAPARQGASSSPSTSPAAWSILQRPQAEAAMGRSATSTGPRRWRPPSRPSCVPVAATDPLYILYTSGTTGKPKGVVRDNGGHAVALAWSMANIYDVGPARVDVHRVRRRLGRRALLHRLRAAAGRARPPCSTRASRSARPTRAQFWRVVAEHGVEGHVHRADRVPRDQEGGPRRAPPGRLRPVGAAVPVPRRRAPRPRDLRWASDAARHPGGRPLVADRDGLADRREPASGVEPLPIKPGSPTVPMPG